jgi:hypothetical protein
LELLVARSPVGVLPRVGNDKVDVLFMIDDSTNLDMITNLKNNFPVFLNRLSQRGSLPDVHIGVVTSDLGTSAAEDAQPGPSIGSGPGSCAGNGKNGNLQTNAVVQGTFIVDEPNLDGSRVTNYTGMLSDAFSAIASVGAAGCGFEQHLEAVKRALNNNPANAGFMRPEANLGVILLGDEDDCSLEQSALMGTDTTTLGPLLSFRCTRFGITCDSGGATPDAMNTPGPKGSCHSNEQSQYLTHLADYKAFLQGLKPDPMMVMVGAIVGDPEPVEVELRPPPGSGTPITALGHSCNYTDVNNQTEVADPAVRDVELAHMFDRNAVGTICQQDQSPSLVAIARQIDAMTGSPCLFRDIAEPHDCAAADDSGPVEACDATRTESCYTLVTDETMCPEGQHLRVGYRGTQTSKLTLSCKLP